MKLSPRRKRKGSILVLVLFLLIILALMGSAFSILLPVEMRNARRDRANIQSAYAADAAVLWVMDQLETDSALRQNDGWDSLEGTTQSLGSEWVWRVQSVDRLAGVEAYRVVTEGIRDRGIQKDVLRRAVAIIDNGLQSQQPAILISSASPDSTGAMGNGTDTYWPGDVPIYGDVLVSGHWAVDDSKINYADGPSFTGQVTQTVGGGNGLRGESYVDPLDANQYNQAYTNGLQAVQTVSPSELSEAIYLANSPTRHRLQEHLFSTSDPSRIDTMNDTTSNNLGLHIPLDSTNMPNGGIVINDGGGNGDEYEMLFSVDGAGNSVMTLNGDSINSINTIKSDSPNTLSPVTGASATGNSFKIIHVTEGGTFGTGAGTISVSPGQDHLVVLNSSNEVIYQNEANFAEGAVIYTHGAVRTQGTFAGKKTVAATLGVTFSGELLKHGISRGDAPTDSEHVLGLIANMEAGNSSKGLSIDITQQTPDNQYHIYASIMGLTKTDVNAKIFGHNLHPNIPGGAKFSFYGQLASGPSNKGQFKKEIEFIDNYVNSFTMDNLPPYWPPAGDGFRSNLRAYIDQQVYDTE